jgi:EAL domain-containing protein (putative c-di-GMP-specific phosphodiesterase class I)
LGDRSLQLSACIGIALFPERDTDAEAVFQQADTALYDAKRQGRGSTLFFHRDMAEAVRRRLDLEQELRGALREGDLHPVFQPIWDLASGRVVGFEALARWHHPERGVISPAEFVPLAEETGLIHELGDWILGEAFSLAEQAHTGAGLQLPLGLSVNLSPAQLARDSFVDEIAAGLERRGLQGCCLKLEVTESLLMENLETARETMARGQGHGITFALDDFGTGYSSLAYLNQLPLEVLKIDRTFVSSIQFGPSGSARIIETILALGHNLNMQVVAEGIEEEHQADFLRRRGCHFGQGYWHSYPLPREQALSLLAAPS